MFKKNKKRGVGRRCDIQSPLPGQSMLKTFQGSQGLRVKRSRRSAKKLKRIKFIYRSAKLTRFRIQPLHTSPLTETNLRQEFSKAILFGLVRHQLGDEWNSETKGSPYHHGKYRKERRLERYSKFYPYSMNTVFTSGLCR